MKIHVAEFANSVDLDKMAYNEPPHLDFDTLDLIFVEPTCSERDLVVTTSVRCMWGIVLVCMSASVSLDLSGQ